MGDRDDRRRRRRDVGWEQELTAKPLNNVPSDDELDNLSHEELVKLGTNLDGVELVYREPRWPVPGTRAEKRAERTVALWFVLAGVFGAALLGAVMDRRWGTLSDGEKKRVLVARAVMTNPELLILDEPAAGMDLGGREDLVGYLGDLAMDPDAPAIVMITHHVEEIPYGFTHAMLLDDGEVVAKGLINSVLTSENLSQAFHQPIQVDRIGQRYFARRIS